ncbi:unnamed protein product [Meganyctiphanes norvegica]|uniref:long-chain-fatty-acid--CoA ligase n=1 Tax=Meganyctiphanes norvegica TaxID=48144 RepID=A0AAV2QVN1_MEGNR
MAEPQTTGYTNGPDQVIPSESITTWDADGAVKLRSPHGGKPFTPISVPTLLKNSADKFPTKKALAVKRDGAWQYTTYTEYYEQARTVAKAFIKLGLQPFHGVCILGFNSPEWFLADLGAIFAGGFAAGIYTTNSPEMCELCAKNCEAQIWVVENAKSLDKVMKIKGNMPDTRAIIQYSGKPTTEGVMSWEELLKLGREQPDNELEQRLKGIAINQCCTLIYTSGTTGPPKGVMMSHHNMVVAAHSICTQVDFQPGTEALISYLPLSHVAAQLADIYVCIYSGATLYFAQPDALKGSLVNSLKEVRPTRFLGVPRVWEKVYEKMLEVGKKSTGIKKPISQWAKGVGRKANARREKRNFNMPLGYSIANAVVFKKVKLALGLDRCKLFLSAAAPIAPEIVKFFHALDIPLTEIYGMSESTGAHTLGVENAFKYGSAGSTIDGYKTKIHEPDADGNGEICMDGQNVMMGYLRKEDKTTEAIDESGWLRTGDIGRIDTDGFLFITGRIKEILITAGGENVARVPIEDTLKENLTCDSNCMFIGDKKKFLSILITLKVNVDPSSGEPTNILAPATLEWCRAIGSSSTTLDDIINGPDVDVMCAIQDGVDKTNKSAPSNAQRVQKWTILPLDFSILNGELGPTMKLKRNVVVKKYTQTIDKFYDV